MVPTWGSTLLSYHGMREGSENELPEYHLIKTKRERRLVVFPGAFNLRLLHCWSAIGRQAGSDRVRS